MKVKTVDPNRLSKFRGKRSREVIAHELRSRGHATDAKAIWRWENGRNRPSAHVLADYADVLGVPIDELYGDDDEEESDPVADLVHAIRRLVRDEVAVRV